MKADIVIVGGGISGACIARELAKYQVDIIVVERHNDVASGTSKANTAILHAGFDAEPGTLKALLGVQGNLYYDALAKELEVPVNRTGSLVVAFSDTEDRILVELLERGRINGVQGLRIVSGNELRRMEPNLSPLASSGLHAESAGIVNPFEMVLACAEEAALNGARFLMGEEVTGFTVRNGQVEEVITTRGRIEARMVINAAGLWADTISAMVGLSSFKIIPRKGEYVVLDQSARDLVRTVLFPVPSLLSKGITVTPTTDGNILLGPTAEDHVDRLDVSTTREGLSSVLEGAWKLVPSLSELDAITVFAGLRAVSDNGDFIIGPTKDIEGFINVAGIQSPGITAAPAIAERVSQLVAREIPLNPKQDTRRRHRIPAFRNMTPGKRLDLFQNNPKYGRVICRCETVTEAEILEAIHRIPGARSIDGVKFHTRAGMGRCQGGFCGPRVLGILSKELKLPYDHITLRGGESRVLIGRRKGGIARNDGEEI